VEAGVIAAALNLISFYTGLRFTWLLWSAVFDWYCDLARGKR
jgi:hypothetical protein